MVAQQTLTLYVRVRILHPLPNLRNFGSGGFFVFFDPLQEKRGVLPEGRHRAFAHIF